MHTNFLFAMPSWLSGAARTLDLGGVFDEYNDSPTPDQADAWALWHDWRAVGESLWDAMRVCREEAPQAADLSAHPK